MGLFAYRDERMLRGFTRLLQGSNAKAYWPPQ
ncbi:hypothetical protein GA0070563_10186 [Micromonospora carbonacea]|uniref:Uncharacterized protein n=1 Tax=Micromonospora carbonacea TaxID=47853 RepID=A0A1C4TXX4_9ACTN|nr:hypothetical protein GA0070563_10186 [Micromonospora carbonacea]